MKKIFVDTNILLDVFLDRQPFCHPAQVLWTLSQTKKIQAAISAISINNIFFIIKKSASIEKAYVAVESLLDFFEIIELNSHILSKAFKMNREDFEDAIQYQSALKFGAEAIVTRDPSGFTKSILPILDTSQYLALLHFSEN